VEHRDTLLTLAEIAVALAGFTGIVGVLGRRTQNATHAISWLRLRAMLEVSLRNAAFAVLPIPFLGLMSSETVVWRVASGAYFVAVVAYILLRRRSEISTNGGLALTRPFLVLLPISLLACVANVLGFGGSNAFSLYLLSLVLGLVTAGMLFLSVAATLFNDEGE
jgi:hypothetical protein